tara:strand:+ start:613 stop:747 length:135 start_codon:yes stop_codon:yes gene_type:complete
MSATPIFDKISEIGLTMNLLKPKYELETGTKFDNKYLMKSIEDN